jgi:hypothetical protein
MARIHHGDSILREVFLTFIDNLMLHVTPDLKNALARIASDYLRRSITSGQARAAFMSLAGCTEPIDRLCAIVEISDNPIPVYDDEEEATGSSMSRRKMKMWSTYEDNRLMAGIYRFGINNWAPISRFVGNGRTRAQCAQRWARGLNPRICKDVWAPEEDMRLVQLVQRFGDKAWTKISGSMGNRSDVQCRYHYHQLTKDMAQLVQMGVGDQGNGFPSFIQENGAIAPVIPGRPLFPARARFSMPQITCVVPEAGVTGRNDGEGILDPQRLELKSAAQPGTRRSSHFIIPPVMEGLGGAQAAGRAEQEARPLVPDVASIVHLLNRYRE